MVAVASPLQLRGSGRRVGIFGGCLGGGIGPVSSLPNNPMSMSLVLARPEHRRLDVGRWVPSSAPPTKVTRPAATKLIGRTRDHRLAADPILFVAGRATPGLDGLLGGGHRVVGHRRLRLHRLTGVVWLACSLDFTIVPVTGSTQKVRWAA